MFKCEKCGLKIKYENGKWYHYKKQTHWAKPALKVNINFKSTVMFLEQIKWRENRYGKPLPTIQKIKAARAVSHNMYPTNEGFNGKRGHNLRQLFRMKILKFVDVDCKPDFQR